MGVLDSYYRGQSSHDWYHAEQDSLRAEALARGVSVRVIENERQAAAVAYRRSEQERINALLADPDAVRQLRAATAPRPIAEDGTSPPAPPLPTWPPVDRNAPPPQAPQTGAPASSGRQVSGRGAGHNVYGAGAVGGGSAESNEFAAAMLRARNRI
jgi:hypothetical protein